MSIETPSPLPVRQLSAEVLFEQQRRLVRVTAGLANYCEHVEHNESHDLAEPLAAGDALRAIASSLAHAAGVSLLSAYRARVAQVERASIHSATAIEGIREMPGADALAHAATWHDVQVAQLLHDRRFHPDVFGLSKQAQLQHYTLHVAKLAGIFIDVDSSETWSAFVERRLADIAIFGVKIATVCNRILPMDGVDAED